MAVKRSFGPNKRTCGTWEYHVRLLETNPRYREAYAKNQMLINTYLRMNLEAGLRAMVPIIPVVVHIIYQTDAQNISDAQVQSQIDVLNQDYRKLNPDVGLTPAVFAPLAADARIQFQLAVRDPNCAPTNGITRTQTSIPSFDIYKSEAMKSNATGGADPWPADKYLNIWVCQGLPLQLGRTTHPGAPPNLDGAIIATEAFGTIGNLYTNYDKGRTATHEIGHYFDLYHLWGDVYDCSGTDYVSDTPNQISYNSGCPAFPGVTCGNGPNGDMFMNYMDYTDDACMFMFTIGQCARMEAALVGPRASLLASDALIPPPPTQAAILWSADTPADTGVEPDTTAATLWESDDIWVRNQNDGVTNQEHQNPVYNPAAPDYVYVRVRNRSCGTGASGNLKLYWAKASTALGWPAPWDGSITSPAVMGGAIGTQPTGVVGGGSSVILQFPWSPPNPADYASFGADQAHFCLLSRIETASTPPYGMTFPEGSNLLTNVQNNNKIVWKNVEVVASTGGRMGTTTVGNLSKQIMRMSFALAAPRGEWYRQSITHLGRLLLDFGQELNGRLRASLPRSDAVQFDDRGRLWIREIGTELGPIVMQGREYHGASLSLDPAELPPGVYAFDLLQFDHERPKDRLIGAQRFIFKLLPIRPKELPKYVFQHWVHSHEEDQTNIETFRPSSYNFPPSRGRRGFEVREDGSMVMYDIAPADGIVENQGYWFAEDPGRIFFRFGDPHRHGAVMKIEELEPDRLVIARRVG